MKTYERPELTKTGGATPNFSEYSLTLSILKFVFFLTSSIPPTIVLSLASSSSSSFSWLIVYPLSLFPNPDISVTDVCRFGLLRLLLCSLYSLSVGSSAAALTSYAARRFYRKSWIGGDFVTSVKMQKKYIIIMCCIRYMVMTTISK